MTAIRPQNRYDLRPRSDIDTYTEKRYEQVVNSPIQPVKYFKVLASDGKSPFQAYRWTLPRFDKAQQVWIPTDWHYAGHGGLAHCAYGFHASTLYGLLTRWNDACIYECEMRGDFLPIEYDRPFNTSASNRHSLVENHSDEKVVARCMRLLRPLNWNPESEFAICHAIAKEAYRQVIDMAATIAPNHAPSTDITTVGGALWFITHMMEQFDAIIAATKWLPENANTEHNRSQAVCMIPCVGDEATISLLTQLYNDIGAAHWKMAHHSDNSMRGDIIRYYQNPVQGGTEHIQAYQMFLYRAIYSIVNCGNGLVRFLTDHQTPHLANTANNARVPIDQALQAVAYLYEALIVQDARNARATIREYPELFKDVSAERIIPQHLLIEFSAAIKRKFHRGFVVDTISAYMYQNVKPYVGMEEVPA